MLRKLLISSLFIVFFIMMAACSHNDRKFLQKDYFTAQKGVVVASCPSGVELIVNDIECVTPCTLKLPDNTGRFKIIYGTQIGYVPVSKSSFHGYELNGTLMILDVTKIGINSDSPEAPYFLRDSSLGLSDFCGIDGSR